MPVHSEHRIFVCGKGPINLVLVTAAVVDKLSAYTQTDPSMPEAGGILLGSRKEQHHLEICSATEPATSDQQSRHEFVRNRGTHQRAAHQLWLRSRGYVDYVGEWHTHPENIPYPSFVDTRGWKRISRHAKRPMVGLIVGTQQWWLGVASGKDLWLTDEYCCVGVKESR